MNWGEQVPRGKRENNHRGNNKWDYKVDPSIHVWKRKQDRRKFTIFGRRMLKCYRLTTVTQTSKYTGGCPEEDGINRDVNPTHLRRESEDGVGPSVQHTGPQYPDIVVRPGEEGAATSYPEEAWTLQTLLPALGPSSQLWYLFRM